MARRDRSKCAKGKCDCGPFKAGDHVRPTTRACDYVNNRRNGITYMTILLVLPANTPEEAEFLVQSDTFVALNLETFERGVFDFHDYQLIRREPCK